MAELPVHPSSDPAVRPQSDLDLGRLDHNPPGLSLRALIAEDFATHDRDPFSQGFWAIAVHRFGNWRMGVRVGILRAPLSFLYRVLAKANEWFGGIDIKYTVKVGRRVRIWHHGGMTLEALEIGDDVHIRQNVTFGLRQHGDARWLKPVIGPGCQIGAGAVIVGPIVVGERSTIGANVVLAQDVPPHSIVTVPKPLIRTLRRA
ncbi:serine O-acetyltransferase [Sphingomonas sp. MMS24-J13]|uniref:serine O-acetyltransferase n=1 Tax=Sphingomonas sp. MMS24-J13 TaxID=3238686 RepID=UPI00384E4122